MEDIRGITAQFINKIELVNIRFPNDKLPLASCEAGNIIYVFTNGAVAVCPYLVFAAQNPDSKHKPEDFIVGNIFHSFDAGSLDNYRFHTRYHLGNNKVCESCHLESRCGKGCPAAIISSGQTIEGVDVEVCPVVDEI